LLMAGELGAGGSERQLTETARALDRALFHLHVACFRPDGMRRRELEDAGVSVLALPVRSLYKSSALLGALQLRRYLRDHRIRLVHTFDTPTNLFGVPVARLAGTPVVLSSQRARRELSPPLSRGLLRVTDRMVDGVVVNCQALVRHMLEDEGVQPGLLHLCHNGIDTSVFHRGRIVRKGPVAGAELVVGAVCGLRPEKRLDLLLDAFAKIAAPGRRLVLVGSGTEEPALSAQAERLGLGPYIHFEPATAVVAEWLHSMDVFVLPSRTEGLSNSLMEAMACGCAAIASDVGGNPEVVSDGSTGLLFPSGDAGALAAALARLADNSGLRSELGARAGALIRERFSVADAARRMAAIYQERLDSR
ncbi:MAG: glycosyltransferase, partial [Bryobacteraceae bacterium]